MTGLPVLAVVALGVWMGVRVVRPAPPKVIHLIGGAEGSSYRNTAEKYKKIIERQGVKVEILPSRGSLDNLQHLSDPAFKADVAFVQGGLTEGVDITRLVS